MTAPPRALVVLPTFNERENLPPLVAALMQIDGVRVLVVDDQSPDGTGPIADRLAAEYPGRVEVLHRTGRRGLGRSYVDGMTRAIGADVDVVCQMDADFSHNPAHLPELIAAAAHADLVVGARYIRGGRVVNWPLRRLILSRFANWYVHMVTRLQTRDCTSGFRCWRREALASMPLDSVQSDGYSFMIEMLFLAERRGFRIVEVPITFVERQQGESKLSKAVLVESAITPWRLAATRDRAARLRSGSAAK
jgi:dolichol-phosphate mannosyltransferase